MIGAFVLAAAIAIPSARYSPPRPTVGGVVRLELPGVTGTIGSLTSDCAEVVPGAAGSNTGAAGFQPAPGSSFRIRSFRPGDCTIRFTLTEGGETQRLITSVRIHSVIPPNDELQPAPVRPPQALPPNRHAFAALGIAAALAAIAWAAAVMRKRRADRATAAPVEVWVDPYEQYRDAIARLGSSTDRKSAAELADATRSFLARIDGRFSRDLTSRELLRALGAAGVGEQVVAATRDLLRRGDVAKFSQGAAGFQPAKGTEPGAVHFKETEGGLEGRRPGDIEALQILEAFTPAKEEAS